MTFVKKLIKKIWDKSPSTLQNWAGKNLISKIRSKNDLLVDTKELKRVFTNAVQIAKDPNMGDYLEFGVYNGTSLSLMYKALVSEKIKNVRLFGFDSFEGLPAEASFDDDSFWHEGQFKCTQAKTLENLKKKKVNLDNIHLIKGFYSETLNPNLIAKYNLKRASIIMIDCDMYLSTRDALNFCRPLIYDKTIIIFDDWLPQLSDKDLGEKKAFDEFLANNPNFKASLIDKYSYKGKDHGRVFLISTENSI